MQTAEAVHLWKYQGQRRADAAIRRSPSVLAIKAIGWRGPRAFADQLNSLRLELARADLAERVGRSWERTISKNIDVQPRLETRPGYRLNTTVDQDIVFREPTNRES
ncbi:MAG: hypothetical protein EOR78_29240 [Mesorhizobium sp.]|uniref:hypothetical protein n=1 Tax=Mesorhizobium sp. TaxID=1871066 RepID=UPI000FE976E3|nr:hypothetical protein [Mesorhizobium sp.]RWH78019.1 MAG: hypothetical protein EOQ85_16920 [Mesorhizobium sp.]RWM48338.1 MAG: hypothetical protein EOR78_29240 [Mesorhizobium sp.]